MLLLAAAAAGLPLPPLLLGRLLPLLLPLCRLLLLPLQLLLLLEEDREHTSSTSSFCSCQACRA